MQSASLNRFGFVYKKANVLLGIAGNSKQNKNVNDGMFKPSQMEKRCIYFYSFLNCKNNLRKYFVRYEQLLRVLHPLEKKAQREPPFPRIILSLTPSPWEIPATFRGEWGGGGGGNGYFLEPNNTLCLPPNCDKH